MDDKTPTVSCWEGNYDDRGSSATCLLPDQHEGPHEFVPDAEIVVTFAVRQNGSSGDDQ